MSATESGESDCVKQGQIFQRLINCHLQAIVEKLYGRADSPLKRKLSGY